MYRPELPRLYELKDLIPDPTSPDAYFRDFEQNLASSAHIKDVFARRERELQGLDGDAWEYLKKEAAPRLIARNRRGRGWQQLFDTLNEARAYNYLERLGCTGVRYIPRSQTKTPDLEAMLSPDRVLCEVKTISISDEEASYRIGPMKARAINAEVSRGFLNKLRSTVEAAKQQLLTFDRSATSLHFVYLNVYFDEFFAECKEEYFKQMDADLAATPVTSVKLVICNEHTAFYKPLQMHSADVDNIG